MGRGAGGGTERQRTAGPAARVTPRDLAAHDPAHATHSMGCKRVRIRSAAAVPLVGRFHRSNGGNGGVAEREGTVGQGTERAAIQSTSPRALGWLRSNAVPAMSHAAPPRCFAIHPRHAPPRSDDTSSGVVGLGIRRSPKRSSVLRCWSVWSERKTSIESFGLSLSARFAELLRLSVPPPR